MSGYHGSFPFSRLLQEGLPTMKDSKVCWEGSRPVYMAQVLSDLASIALWAQRCWEL